MTNLRNEIIELEKLLLAKKNELFVSRLSKMTAPICNVLSDSETISDITFHTSISDSTWQISYVHKTDKYTPVAYMHHDDSADDSANEINPYSKTTKITFGKTNKYFIKGGIDLMVYRNSNSEIRIINKDYEYEIDLDEQRTLMLEYSSNVHIPEWLAIKTLLYISDNKWNVENVVIHFCVI